ncbi:unnamed protein product [Medioppia subpectinata]|uniref:F-box domain-containing protein n=1 Tax=Medioppia subpectinata TaxID=1979941 RepID=A0A7R9KRZ8_9ACAR|nr:unnamed protein product [Medioppia subpectinata]CAG2108735.1 unnamed protein product [Medioppia subpectinata]
MFISLEITDDGNEDNRQQAQIYALNSMDRFGDDLCQLLLSYLSLEDRFRLELVSKQFQRTFIDSFVKIRSKVQMLATIVKKLLTVEE